MEERPPESREALANQLDEGVGESGERFGEEAAGSGWVTTKQAAKVLDVSRRSVQSYVRRGLLQARAEGDGPNKRFLVSIDSLNALLGRRRHEAEEAANSAGGSPESEEAANPAANIGEGLRHVVDRLEARTAEATELRVRLELTERAESTLRAELEAERRRREEAEREREELRRELEALREPPDAPQAAAEEPEGSEPRPVAGGAQETARRRSWWREFFGFE